MGDWHFSFNLLHYNSDTIWLFMWHYRFLVYVTLSGFICDTVWFYLWHYLVVYVTLSVFFCDTIWLFMWHCLALSVTLSGCLWEHYLFFSVTHLKLFMSIYPSNYFVSVITWNMKRFMKEIGLHSQIYFLDPFWVLSSLILLDVNSKYIHHHQIIGCPFSKNIENIPTFNMGLSSNQARVWLN